MRVSDLERLYDYNYWANKQLIGVVSQLTPEQFTQSVAGSYGSVRNTLVHVLSAEWGWLDRCGGPERGARLNPEDYPTVESLVRAWTRVEEYVRGFLSGLKDEDLTRDIEFAIGGGPKQAVPLGDLMQHAAVHAVHHRGQVALLLRTLGYVPSNFDLLLYVGERRSVPGSTMAPTRANGKICYLEIPTADIARSVGFYQAVFGWPIRRRGDGATAFDDGVGEVSGAWVTGRPSSPSPGLLLYVMVDSVPTTVEAVVAHGGRIVQPIGVDAPELTARFADPDGNVLGLYQQPNQSS